MKNKIKKILIIIIGILVCASTQAHAALSVKPATVTNGSNVLVNTSITNSFLLCKQMTNAGESLYGTTVKPHLATNKDWGAVSYLSQSAYGTNSAGQNTGTQITINGVNYYSTNGNATGVMNWGSNPNKTLYSQTSGIIQEYLDLDDKSTGSTTAPENIVELVTNSATDFVEVFGRTYNSNTTKGMAMTETMTLLESNSNWKRGDINVNYPISMRNGLFGFRVGYSPGYVGISGEADKDATFRPVIWN